MPYANEHSARLRDPGDFDADSFRRTNGGTIYGSKKVPETIAIIWGKLKGKAAPDDPVLPQALRFPTKNWTVAEAKKWLKDNEIKYISFEAAKDSDSARTEPPVRERRFISADACRVRTVKRDAGGTIIEGYAAVFYDPEDPGTEFQLWGDTVERIMAGAFDHVLTEGDDARALFNHSPDHLLGRVTAKTLRLTVDKRGLKYEIDPPDTQLGRDTVISIDRGDLTGSSFCFIVGKTMWILENEGTDHERTIREIHEISELFDVGPVTYPAYESTTAGVRSENDLAEARASFEAWKAERVKDIAADLAMRERRLRLLEVDGF